MKGSGFGWGLLGPDEALSERRIRTLGVGASIRVFNQLAVPGLGGVWYGKQLFLATLGIVLAEKARERGKSLGNIEAANAVEALACCLALKSNKWTPESRIRGALKLHGKQDNLDFATVRKPGFYVTQPMRMATNEPLLSLGLVDSESERFNAYRSSQDGRDFVKIVCEGYGSKAEAQLLGWVLGAENLRNATALVKTLSPIESMPQEARAFLRDRLIMGGTGDVQARRRKSLSWVEEIRKNPSVSRSWKNQPQALEEFHWKDLRSGAAFFAVRDAAIELLDRVESHIANCHDQRVKLDAALEKTFLEPIRKLIAKAGDFLDLDHDPSPGKEAGRFCRECTKESGLLEKLIDRDDRVLQMRADTIVPGPAFRGETGGADLVEYGASDGSGATETAAESVVFPDGISYRMKNLYYLNLDLHGALGEMLGSKA